MNFGMHLVAQNRIHHLMPLYQRLSHKGRADDKRLEVNLIRPVHIQMLTVNAGSYPIMQISGGGHGLVAQFVACAEHLVGYPEKGDGKEQGHQEGRHNWIVGHAQKTVAEAIDKVGERI